MYISDEALESFKELYETHYGVIKNDSEEEIENESNNEKYKQQALQLLLLVKTIINS